MENLEKIREALMEAIAETNEEYMDRYFSGEEFTYDEIRYALRMNVRSGDMVPVLVGTGINGNGCRCFSRFWICIIRAPMRTLSPVRIRRQAKVLLPIITTRNLSPQEYIRLWLTVHRQVFDDQGLLRCTEAGYDSIECE